MADSQSERVLNGVLIDLARSFLQYVSESWPWIDDTQQAIGNEVEVLAARQRQDVADLANELVQREWAIDFGSFPTEYTDLQFLSLGAMLSWLKNAQTGVCQRLNDAEQVLQSAGDSSAAELITAITIRQKELSDNLLEIEQKLTRETSEAASA